MKHIISFVICMLLSVVNASAANERYEHEPDDYVYYDVNSGQPFVYDRTFPGYTGKTYFNCPFAYNIIDGGNRVSFSITNEDFKWFIVRKTTDNYIDFEVSKYDGEYLPWPEGKDPYIPVIGYTYIIRVEFDR